MGKKVICNSFMLHVRGGGSAIAIIERLLQHLKLRGLDCQAGDIFKADTARANFVQWQAYRNQVAGKKNAT